MIMKIADKIRQILNSVLKAVCACLLAFMSLLTCYQVFMRYVIKHPSTISEDILSYSFVWVSLFATTLVFGERDHMNLTFFLDKFNFKVKTIVEILTEVLIGVIAVVVFFFGGIKFMSVGALQVSPTLKITMNYIYVIMPICGILICIYSILNIVKLLDDFRKGEQK
jgi:TRAP-type C4-dicarboxylate transport system permease small subunit